MHAGAECPGLNWVPAVATATAAAAIQTVWPRAQRQALWAPYQAQSRWHLIIRGNPMRGTGAVWAVATLAACWGLVLGSSPPFCIGPGRAGVLDRYHTPPGGAAVHLLLSVYTRVSQCKKKPLQKHVQSGHRIRPKVMFTPNGKGTPVGMCAMCEARTGKARTAGSST
jgi:hypothetical protein